MGNKVHAASSLPSSITTTNATMIRRKNKWIIFGILASIVVITTIVVPISIVITSGKITSTTKALEPLTTSTTTSTITMTTTLTTSTTTSTITMTTTITTTYTSEDNTAQFINSSCLVNAWIHLDEDQPLNTNYKSPNSSFQTLIQNNVYQSVNILYICFVSTTITNSDTIPVGNGSSYTIKINPASHSSGLTNQDYMNNVISDARKNNPNIKIAVTLDWGKGNPISDIFSTSRYSPQEAAKHFAANLMAYLKKHDLDGFDIDWESPISHTTSREQFTLLINAIGTEFKQQTNKHYYLTLSPADVGNLDAKAVNIHIDFVNLQLYSGFTYPDRFKNVGVNPNLFAYGAKFERAYQTAIRAYQDNKDNYHYNIFSCWRLNSDNYIFEQIQQQHLHELCHDPHF